MVPLSYEEFALRATEIQNTIRAICVQCGRDPASVGLMAVTKTHGPEAVQYAARYGLKCVGENRVQEGVEKKQQAACAEIRFELIGTLQTNKARLAAASFDRIQSVDRIKLVHALQRHCEELGRPALPVLLQVNAGNDPAKQGADVDQAADLLEAALSCDRLKVEGLMTIAPLDENRAVALRCFQTLAALRDTLQTQFGVALPELSMGMSGDMEEAIAAGSTLVRIGTALFGSRF